MPKRQRTVAQVEEDLKRWTTKFRRAMTAINRLEVEKKRIIRTKALATLAQEKPRQVTMIGIAAPQVETDHLPEPEFQKLAETMENKDALPRKEESATQVTIGLPTSDAPGTSAYHGKSHPDLEIPEWLKRAGPIGHKTPADLKALAEIEADKKARAKAKAEKKHGPVRSKKLGPDAQRMPLTGRAALEAIRRG